MCELELVSLVYVYLIKMARGATARAPGSRPPLHWTRQNAKASAPCAGACIYIIVIVLGPAIRDLSVGWRMTCR